MLIHHKEHPLFPQLSPRDYYRDYVFDTGSPSKDVGSLLGILTIVSTHICQGGVLTEGSF